MSCMFGTWYVHVGTICKVIGLEGVIGLEESVF